MSTKIANILKHFNRSLNFVVIFTLSVGFSQRASSTIILKYAYSGLISPIPCLRFSLLYTADYAIRRITDFRILQNYKNGSEILVDQGKSKNPRKLTPRECARLQGFPETFIIPVSDTQAYKQFGNSVAVPVVRAVARRIFDMLKTLEISK